MMSQTKQGAQGNLDMVGERLLPVPDPEATLMSFPAASAAKAEV